MLKKLFATLFVMGLALQVHAASVKPLYFVDGDGNPLTLESAAKTGLNIDADDDNDSLQQKYWNYLMKFKLWGTTGITMGNDVVLPDSSGWNGAASGGLIGTARDTLGGPVIVNGDIALGDQTTLLKGPIRTTGNFTAGNDNGGHAFYGTVCVSGTIDGQVQKGIDRAKATLVTGKEAAATGVCSADKVPFILEDLRVPEIPEHEYSGDVNVGSGVAFIDVPPGSGTSDVYDLYLNSISIGNEGKLFIRMPNGGRLTRIFLKSLSFGTHPTIQVSYMGPDAKFEGGTYTATGDTVIRGISQYDGNLLFYVPHDINFVNTDNRPVQGTFISTGTINMACNMEFAGQLLANKIELGNNINGSGFIYVPFDPPEIDIEGLVNDIKFIENDQYVKIPVTLTKTPETNVYIDYCFYPGSAGGISASESADMDDLGPEDESEFKYLMPACSEGESRTIVIPAGFQTAQDDESSAWIYVKTDGKVEGDEKLIFYVNKISGAVIKGNATNGGVYLTLKDLDKNPPTFEKNDTLGVSENDVGGSAGKIEVSDPDGDAYSLAIIDGTGKDLFTIDNDGNISLKAETSVDYEANQSFTVTVQATDADGLVSKQTYTIAVIDVNEKPIVNKKTYDVEENLADGKEFAKVSRSDTDTLNNKTETRDFVKHNIVEAIGGDTDVFGVTPAGMIYVIHGDSLDFEKRTEYSLLVKVRDTTDVALWDTATVFINVTDVTDVPEIVTKDTTVIVPKDPENPSGAKDTLKNIGSNKAVVDENNEAGVYVGIVLATCTDTTKTLYYGIEKDTSGLFDIDRKTGVIYVKDEMVLDYEKIKSYGITVVVYDGDIKTTDKDGVSRDADGVIVQSAKKEMVINVGDVNEAPILNKQTFEIVEHNGAGAGVDQYGMGGKDDGNKYWIEVGDIDKSKEFAQHTLTVIGGDSALFYLGGDQGDEILAKKELDFEQYAATGDTVFKLVVKATDKVPGPHGEELYVVDTMTIVLKNKNEVPTVTTDTLYVTENSKGGSSVDTLKASDPDGDKEKLTYEVSGTSPWFEVSKDGAVIVKKDAGIDFETTPTGTITVVVKDADGASSTKTLTVVVIDENEKPVVKDTTVSVSEDTRVGTEVGHVAASDPDIKNPAFGTLTYTQVTGSEKFQVSTDGSIKLIEELDYETDSVYTLKVYVTDGTYGDTATVTVKVGNVLETSKVEITTAINKDSTWKNPETIYVNQYDIDIIWTEDGVERRGDTTLTEGKNIIIKEFKDPTKDLPGYDTLIVYVSTATPIVTVSKAAADIEAANIYTIVEDPEDTSSTTFYVNNPKSDILVKVTDPVDSTKSTSFTLSLNLAQESLPKVSSTNVKVVAEIADATPALNEDAPNAIRTPVNGEKIAVSYTDKIAGKDVVVTYYTDNKGNILKGESGKEEMTVSYTVTVDGKEVVMSFKADPLTGSLIPGENGANYTVNFDYVDKNSNSVSVSYGVDESGKIVKNASGDMGYEVSYTYVNKYGNSATQSVFIVLDQKPPLVWIKTPTQDQVIHSNMVDVVWYVSATGDSADFVLQDTLKVQGLEKGANAVVRFYIDKAGNMASDTVYVIMKNAKDVEIAIEKPLTVIDADSVAKYYEKNPPKKGQTFAVSLGNPSTGVEKETLIGGSFKNKKGNGETPYPGAEGSHLGPTLGLDLKLPIYNSVGGLATLDDLVSKDGLVSLDGVDAKNSKKMPVEDYVKEYCSTDFILNHGSDYSKANLYNTVIKVKIWVYTTLGTFVDYFSFKQELNDPSLVDEAGLINMYFEQKPDKDGFVRTADGKLYASGAYLYKTEVEMFSTAQCTLPPVGEQTGIKKGSRRKTSEELLKPFGYRRPVSK